MAATQPVEKQPGAGLPIRTPLLAVAVLLLLCLYLGLKSASWFARDLPLPAESAEARIVRWRRTRYTPARDLLPGRPAPALLLKGPSGRRVAVERGRRTLVVFLADPDT
jgi:hypothetical protein